MFRTRFCVAMIAMFFSAVALGQPVQFLGNGHYYERIAPTNGITWTDARTAAVGMSFLGMSGHLATFTSAAEMQFGFQVAPTGYTWIGLTDEVTEGQFLWVTGEPFVYSDWLAGEPNNQASGPGEDYVMIDYRNPAGGWNDGRDLAGIISGPPIGYLVEFEAVPEPATLSLFAVAAAGLLCRRRRC